jgi:hypothetical protein
MFKQCNIYKLIHPKKEESNKGRGVVEIRDWRKK